VDDGGSGRLSVLVVHQGALLEWSDSGGENELEIRFRCGVSLKRVVGSCEEGWRKAQEEMGERRKSGGCDC
jgi:hypothetical protein